VPSAHGSNAPGARTRPAPPEGPITTSAHLQRTPLYERHVALGAKLVEFAGWAMPVQYDGLLHEHARVRTQAGLFDVSHMGELAFEGPSAAATLDRLATNDVTVLRDGQALYTALCNEAGGVRDDALIYRLDGERFLMVVNASNTAKIVDWVQAHLLPGTRFEDRSPATALLAVQGPRSLEVLQASRLLAGFAGRLPSLPYYEFATGSVGGRPALVSRTGYTGELGFEVFVAPTVAGDLWDELLERGRAAGLGPAGLGARDTLRFEVCFSLYGNELSEDVTPLESGIGWTVKLKKPDFIGRPSLVRLKAAGLPRKLVGFEVPAEARAIARHGFEVRSGERRVGWVTSGTFAPTLGRSLGLALVDTAAAGGPLAVRIRNRDVAVQLVPMPFHKPASRT
jgi:aminomethyltransferase